MAADSWAQIPTHPLGYSGSNLVAFHHFDPITCLKSRPRSEGCSRVGAGSHLLSLKRRKTVCSAECSIISIRQRRLYLKAATFEKNGKVKVRGLTSGPGKKSHLQWETNQPTHRGSSVARSQVTMPRSKSLGRLARILPRIGARWFHVTWNDWNWGKMGGESYGICDDNWGERYSRWPGVSFLSILPYNGALACPLEWA